MISWKPPGCPAFIFYRLFPGEHIKTSQIHCLSGVQLFIIINIVYWVYSLYLHYPVERLLLPTKAEP